MVSTTEVLSKEPIETEVDELTAIVVPEDTVAAIERDEGVSIARVELYDLGSTCHLSLYRADFTNYVDLPVRVFKTANMQQFDTVGHGDLVVEVPNVSGRSFSFPLLYNIRVRTNDLAYWLSLDYSTITHYI